MSEIPHMEPSVSISLLRLSIVLWCLGHSEVQTSADSQHRVQDVFGTGDVYVVA